MRSGYIYKVVLFVVFSIPLLGLFAISTLYLLHNKNGVNNSHGEVGHFVIYGDSRTGNDKHKEIIEQILKINPKAVLHTGDLVEDGRNPAEWDEFLRITKNLREEIKFYPVYGNHERNVDRLMEIFDLPRHFYKINYEEDNITFILLDSNLDLSKDSEQYIWLENELSIEDNKDNLVVIILHHPLFTVGRHDSSELKARDDLRELFARHRVNIVFSGHNHTYERLFVGNTYYVVTGGGGSPLYDKVRNSQFLQKFEKTYNFVNLRIDSQAGKFFIDVYNNDGKIIDSFQSSF